MMLSNDYYSDFWIKAMDPVEFYSVDEIVGFSFQVRIVRKQIFSLYSAEI